MKFFYILLLLLLVGCGKNSKNSKQTSYKYDDIFISNIKCEYNNSALNYLNCLRNLSGEVNLSINNALNKAAYNHSLYMYENNETGHYEDSNKPYFTGETPSKRALKEGYNYKGVIENVSTNQLSYQDSIDSLFSAIYHRFGFLSLEIDEIGLANNNNFYTYDMGNSKLNERCLEKSFDGSGEYYINVCKDENKKIEKSDFLSRKNYLKNSYPSLIVWPAVNSDNILPAFFEETPDPLPDYKVSGYPVSVEFNDKKIDSVSVIDFNITDDNNHSLTLIKLMDKENDINHEFTPYQFAIFPKRRLDWGERYFVNLKYVVNKQEYVKRWCFSVRSLSRYKIKRVYKIKNQSSLDIVSGVEYALYFVPKDGNDTIKSYSISYNANSVDTSFIDSNTLKIKVDGNIGEYVKIHFNNKTLTLTINYSDNASYPLDKKCN